MSIETDLYEEIESVLENDVSNRHSYYQLKYFVIYKEPTHQSRLWRCLKELKARHESLQSIQLEIEDQRDNLVLANLDIKELEKKTHADEVNRKHTDVQIRKRKRHRQQIGNALEKLSKKLEELSEEAIFFLNAYKQLEKIEPLKNEDDLSVQEEYWNEKLAEELRIKLLLRQPLDVELARTILALRNTASTKQELVGLLTHMRDESRSAAKVEKVDTKEFDVLLEKATQIGQQALIQQENEQYGDEDF